jgi:hypothetical protein
MVALSPCPHPVSIVVEPQITGRNRLTTALRPILAIPHAIVDPARRGVPAAAG